jgi:hypothetical protein
MYTTYHFSSAQELNVDILEAIKTTFKSMAITITIEEDDDNFELSVDLKKILDERVSEDESTYLTSKEAFNALNKKYGLLGA